MAAAKILILKNTNTEVVVKVVADSANTASSTALPLSGFTTATETVTSPTVNIRGMLWSSGAGGSINIYRGGSAESNLVSCLSGNGSFNQMNNFVSDSDQNSSDLLVNMSQYGTLYLLLGKQSGYTTTYNSEQAGQAA